MKRSLLLFGIPFIVFMYLSLVLFQKSCDYPFSLQAKKMVPFNHKTHLTKYGLGKDCTGCHGYDDNGRYMGLPNVGKCTECHSRDGESKNGSPDNPLRKASFDNYKDSDVPWESYATQPDLVYFSHKVVMTAKYDDGRLKARCGSCHGDKANSTSTAKIKGKMLMGQCEDCHRHLDISNKCAVCHD